MVWITYMVDNIVAYLTIVLGIVSNLYGCTTLTIQPHLGMVGHKQPSKKWVGEHLNKNYSGHCWNVHQGYVFLTRNHADLFVKQYQPFENG